MINQKFNSNLSGANELTSDLCSVSVAGCSAAYNIDDLVQDCSISIANALEILQSSTKPSI